MAIHQQGNALVCVAEFLTNGAAATGLTVAVDIYEIGQASGSATLIVSSGVATEIARGAYYYRLPAVNVDLNALYLFIFFTAGTADQKTMIQGWAVGMTWVENVNASIAGVAAAVWAVGTRTLTSFGTLATDTATEVWNASTRTLSSFGTLVADVSTAVWSAGSRTLTSFGSVVVDTAALVWSAPSRTLTDFGTLVADMWAYSTRTLSSFGTLVADTAAAVWNSVASSFNSAGTMGEKLNTAAAVQDPWATELPGSYDDGTAGHILGTLNASEITLVSPLLEGSVLQLVAGDAYDIDHGRALDDWALTGQPSLVDATVLLVIDEAVSVEAISIAGAGSSSQVPVFELTAEQTGALTRFGERAYRYQIQATWAADAPEQPAVLAHGDVTVIERAA